MFLAGCSAASSNSANSSSANSGSASSSGAKAASGQAGPAPALTPAGSAAARSAPGGTGTTALLAPASSIIYTAQLTVRADNVSSAADQAAQIAEDVGGYVSSETASADPDHP